MVTRTAGQGLRDYARAIELNLRAGNFTEHTHRPALKMLLEGIGAGVVATNEPRRIECGAPDFVVTKGTVTLGYVEAKDVGKGLDDVERGKGSDGERFKRYLTALPNLVLTDYLEFRWYVDGQRRGDVARLGTVATDGRVKADRAGQEAVGTLLADFLAHSAAAAGTAKDLAERMARLGQMIRVLIVAAFEKEPESGSLHAQFKAFEDNLIPGLTVPQFADMYAQTIAYGLFAARAAGDRAGQFSRQNAAYLLPKTNPFLRKLFNHIAGPELDDRIAWLVDDLAQLLAQADMAAILKDFGRRTAREDPVVHFYETFLAAYNPEERVRRGVYYTPEPVVSYIVRSVDHLLKTRFSRPQGLADGSVYILDPAVGTGTFLYDVVKLIHEATVRLGQQGLWDGYVAQALLPRLFGFELLMAPYAVAHLKLGLLLEETGYQFRADQRLGVYLTNTLEEAFKRSEQLAGFNAYIVDEANAAAQVKKELPIMVVLGNPPYSVSSLNRGDWIDRLLDDYKRDLHEKKLNIDDDYIKFVRFAQWRIEQTGHGVLGFITNNSYLDGLTHRRMRECLMETFSTLYVLNLHGNSLRGERAPDGSEDKNVFDIRQGVAILLGVKAKERPGPTVVHYADLWGTRETKYSTLSQTDVTTTPWVRLAPTSPHFFFVPKEFSMAAEYERGWKVTDVFGVFQNGLKTDRDELFIGFEARALQDRIQLFFSKDYDADFRTKYRVYASSSFDIEARREKSGFSKQNINRCLYRPFDVRWLYYDPQLTSRPAYEVMRHMLAGENVALVTTRQTKEEFDVFATNALVGHKSVAAYDINTVFPLYLYPSDGELKFEKGRRPNLNPDFVKAISDKLGLRFVEDGRGDLEETIGPEDVFHYAYAVFHSPTYRSRYAEFLKIDFPRLPLTSDRGLFAALAAKGAELVALHLMEAPALSNLITRYPVPGSNTVENVRYAESDRRVYINKSQYFEGVDPEVWNFHIGGYQVCQKWLKDRKGRALSLDDLLHYQKVVLALKETIRLMAEIDAVIPAWPMS